MGVGADYGNRLSAQTVLEKCPALKKVGDEGVASLYRLPDGRGTVGLITPLSHEFCGACSRIRITADGRLKPCLHSDAEFALRGLSGAELEQAIRRGILDKPARHHLNAEGVTETHRAMNEIGG